MIKLNQKEKTPMRWYEWIALILIIALTLGAYVFGTEWATNGLFAPRTDSAFQDTYYVDAHRHYMRAITFVLAGGVAVFAMILLWGRVRIRQIASATVVVWGISVALTVLPQFVISLRGMPRRYEDASDGLSTAHLLSDAANFAAMIAALVLTVLLIIALIQRLRNTQGNTPAT